MSSLLMTDAEYNEDKKIKKSKYIKNILIEIPSRKSEFVKRKKWLLENLEKDNFLESYYELSKEILFESADEYVKATGKSKNSLFKLRGFDKDYIRPQIEKYLTGREEAQ
ncbi:MAG: hypothetical protein EOO43_10635 [Flavobacterium sp.]|nr:MAG: hypothetical protein EOO43_10635 [Flavobacterium sp.]